MIGIETVNEFYTNHYLAAIVGGDVRPVLERWRAEAKDGEGGTPWRRLAQLQQEFFRYRDQLERLRGAAARVEAHHGLAGALLGALGYELGPLHRELSAGPLPLLGAWARPDGEPLLWLLGAPSGHGREDDLLARPLLLEQHELVPPPESGPAVDLQLDRGKLRVLHKRSVEELVTDAFGLEDPPRFVIIVGDTEWVLADRGKWAEQRLLRFDWVELLGRRETGVLELVTALLHRESLAPASGTSLVDTLDDSSHKHAYEVSEDLKVALRESIERIGNEAIRYRREVSKQKVFGEEIDGQELAIQCIRFMYRVLFLLYIEARPELGYAPMGSDAYRLGYSFERLRELEMLELDTAEAQDGFYIHACLDRLFRMVYEGTEAEQQQALLLGVGGARGEGESVHHAFNMVPLRSHLFDPERTRFLNFGFVKLRNSVLLEMIRSMSLSAPKGKGKHKRRGRISYATLGINQLGAVYEALLSFRGFFAEQTLYEVKPAKVKKPDPVKDPAYFVPEGDLKQYKKEERVFDDDGEPVSYPPGSFIYRMAGRDRQKSASYYTPEVLTKCLVKYALKELLENEDGSPKFARAEDLLELTICEPAMGSAAFLNEAINQLSERYLQRRQQELGERIPHDRYRKELQRVRMYIADNNVYGVDLNPIAIELAEVSLWLNAIFTDQTEQGTKVFVPWFGGQLACGNSLVGAWRKVFTKEQLRGGKKGAGWLDAVPERIMLGTERPKGSVYHFLLPDRGMAMYGQGNEGKPIREMCKAELAKIEEWRGKMCEPVSKEDVAALVRLSDAIDKLWVKHIELFRRVRERTTDPLSVYGHEHPLAGRRATTTEEKDRIWSKEMASEQVRASSPYRRLKLAMDYWCALWFWPIGEAELLPDRDEWLTDMAMLLDNEVLPDLKGGGDQRDLFAPTMPAEEARELVEEIGFADVDRLIERWPRLTLISRASQHYRFHHWELEYADLFRDHGGFALVLGNPPWVKLEWKEHYALGDLDAAYAVQSLDSKQTSLRRTHTLADASARARYLEAHHESAGHQAFLTCGQVYHGLAGIQPNLYKSFLPVSWNIAVSEYGTCALLHPDGVYEDPKGGGLRKLIYERIRYHFHFMNEKSLFAEVHHNKKFGVHVYGPRTLKPEFVHISNLFIPSTIDECFLHHGDGPIPGLKSLSGAWAIEGHSKRIIDVKEDELRLFARLYDQPTTPFWEARLPAIHSKELVVVLRSFSAASVRLEDVEGIFSHNMWDESRARKKGMIKKSSEFVDEGWQFVMSGPHFTVGNPLYKTPRRSCAKSSDYDVLDLVELPEDYRPRTTYTPAEPRAEYQSRFPRVPWGAQAPNSSYYRIATPRMIDPKIERTLKVAIMPKEVAHLDTVYGYACSDTTALIGITAAWLSLPVDFYLRSMGVSALSPNVSRRLPVISSPRAELRSRTLLLNCLTVQYAALWSGCYSEDFLLDKWSSSSALLQSADFSQLSEEWTWDTPLRYGYARRQALVELDVLVSMELGLGLSQLINIYTTQFYVFRSNEENTWYDKFGRVVFTTSRGLTGVGLPRNVRKGNSNPSWNDVKHMSEEAGYTGTDPITQIVQDDTLPGGPRQKTITYHPPWVRCDRERDYEIAWDHFARRFGLEGHS